jgi:hypothetical protein
MRAKLSRELVVMRRCTAENAVTVPTTTVWPGCEAGWALFALCRLAAELTDRRGAIYLSEG